jgi:hypothetical protein
MTKNELFKALASLIIDYGELYILISYQNLLKNNSVIQVSFDNHYLFGQQVENKSP